MAEGDTKTEVATGAGLSDAAARPAPPPTDDPEKLLNAANAASTSARNSWLAFMGLIAYLLITLAGVTHVDLLLNSPVRLPIINVEIPLFSFFLVTPYLVVLVHLNLLIQHTLLGKKYQHFSEAIAANEESGERNHPMRRLVSNYVFAQMVAGPRTAGPMRFLMRLMVFVTFTFLPIVTLLYFQITFLPVHDVITIHFIRGAILLDLILLFVVRPYIAMPYLRPHASKLRLGEGDWRWELSYASLTISGFLFIVVAAFSWLVATVPQACIWPTEDKEVYETGNECFSLDQKAAQIWRLPVEGWLPETARSLHNALLNVEQDEGNNAAETKLSDDRKVFALTDWLFEGEPDQTTGRAKSWFSRNLIVIDKDLVEKSEFEDGETTLALRGRDLRFATFDRSDLRGADLYGADLRSASAMGTNLDRGILTYARMEGTDLSVANMQGADLNNARMRGALLIEAQMQGADLPWAQMQGAVLSEADMREADLTRGQLQGADLRIARIQEADLSYAQMQGAKLEGARMQGANLSEAQMQGAILWNAQLQGAKLEGARMQGASLNEAQMQGTDFSKAQMQGANLRHAQMQVTDLWLAQLQCADLRHAQLQGAILVEAQMQGAKLEGAQMQGADLWHATVWQTVPPSSGAVENALMKLFYNRPYQDALQNLSAGVPDEEIRECVIDLSAPLLEPDAVEEWSQHEYHKVWLSLQNRPQPAPEEIAIFLANLACNDVSGGYIARGVARRVLREHREDYPALTAAKLVDPETCAAAKHLDEKIIAELKDLATSADTQTEQAD